MRTRARGAGDRSRALCATNTAPSSSASSSRASSVKLGATATEASSIPCTAVASGGIGPAGRTRLAKRSSSRPSASSRTTARETISSASTLVPVVSRSTTAYAAGAGTSLRRRTCPVGPRARGRRGVPCPCEPCDEHVCRVGRRAFQKRPACREIVRRGGVLTRRAWRCELDEPAERVRELQVLDGAAVDLEQPRRAGDVREALRARDGDVQSVARHQEVEPARDVLAARRRHRVEDDRRPRAPGTCRRCRPRRRAGSRSRSSRTCALYGATTITSACTERPLDRDRRGTCGRAAARSPLAIASASSSDSTRFPSCATASQRTPTPSEVVRSAQPGIECEPPLVERLRDEPADLRVHPPRLLEEDAHLLGNRLVVAEDVLEHADAPEPSGMDALRHLRELERVAEQDEPPRRRPAGERVGEADTARPRRRRACRASPSSSSRAKSQAVPATSVTSGSSTSRSMSLVLHVLALVVVAALDPLEVEPLLGRRLARSRRAGCGSPCGSAR